MLLMVMMAVGGQAWAVASTFGSATDKTWAATSAMTSVEQGSTVTLDGVVMTFGNVTDGTKDYSWSWNSSNSGLLCTMTPSNDGSAYVSSWKSGDAIPSYGCVFKFVPARRALRSTARAMPPTIPAGA